MLFLTHLFDQHNIIFYISNKFSKYVIKKTILCMVNEEIDYIITSLENKWSSFNPKDQKKLNSLFEKMYSKKYNHMSKHNDMDF